MMSILASATGCKAANASATIYIRADGSIDPAIAPIQRNGDVYTLTGNIYSDVDGIVIERNYTVLDGAGFTIQGTGAASSKGIYLSGICNATVRDFKVRAFESGILFDRYSVYNEASGCKVEDNDYGINCWGYADNNTIIGNNITSNHRSGIWMVGSSNNSVAENSIQGNSQYGINLESSSNESIYHNDFIGNTNQVSIYDSTGTWDNGYPSGGNYWSGYAGSDVHRGPNQDQPGSDGIGDTPYTIDVNNVDNCPLTKPYGGFHDIGLIKGPTTKTAISQGKDLNVTIIIINYGFTTETSNITAYFDTTQLVQTQITLTSRNSTALKYVLNTTDLTRGNHTITAYADPVPGETDATDNTLHSLVIITFPGDINGDGRVDMKDVSFVAKRFGSDPSKPNWDTSADINDDGRVDMKDISAVAKNFGKSGP